MQENLQPGLFEKAMHAVLTQQGIIPVPVSPCTMAFLRRYDIPGELQSLLLQHSYSRPVKTGSVYFDKVNVLEKENTDPQQISCLRDGLLIIGCGKNGDPLVVDLHSFTIGFVFHDEIWEKKNIRARDVFADTGMNLGEFFYTAVTDPELLPACGYEAESFQVPVL